MTEIFLTVEQVADRLQMHPDSVRRQLKRGAMRGIKRGTRWRVPESAVEESTPPELQRDYNRQRSSEPIGDTPEARAKAIFEALESGDKARRNAAIIELARSDERTVEIVTQAAAQAVEEWDGPEDDLAALFAPPTPAEIARRLAVLDSMKQGANAPDPNAPALDLETDPWGYEERADNAMESRP